MSHDTNISNGKKTSSITPTSNGKHSSTNDVPSTTSTPPTQPPQKSLLIAYLLWFFGGLFGLHHLYLHRDRHAFIWWATLGGYFGIGWIGEIFLIPGYVRDANEDPRFIKKFVENLKLHQRPPYSSIRFVGEVMVGYFAGQLVSMAIPGTLFGGIDFNFLHWSIPLFIAVGVWTVGNIGRERGEIWHCLVASIAVYPIRYFIYDETYTFILTAAISALVFDNYSKVWLREPPKRRGIVRRTVTFSAALLVYFAIWGCYFYFNGTITDQDGSEVPVHEAIRNVLASSWWTEFKQTLRDICTYAQHHGWYEIWKEVLESIDVDGERNAYKVLGVSATASQAEITSAYRKLSKEFHPDKVKNAAERTATQQRFIEIQQAYEVLSKIKSSRRRKNKKSVDTDSNTIVL